MVRGFTCTPPLNTPFMSGLNGFPNLCRMLQHVATKEVSSFETRPCQERYAAMAGICFPSVIPSFWLENMSALSIKPWICLRSLENNKEQQ